MNDEKKKKPKKKGSDKGLFNRFLDQVEKSGNKLPDPVTVFVIIIGFVMAASLITSFLNVSVTHPGTNEQIEAVNLFSGENIQRIFREMPETFAEFPPLGLVLVVMLGIGVADRTGLITTSLKRFVEGAPDSLITAAIVFAGIMSSLAADAGYVVLIPLGAVLFYGIGRHPLAGLAAAFAGVSAGFSANLLLTSLDPLLVGFTDPAAKIVDEDYFVNVASNWYIMIALVPIFVLSGWYVTEKIIEPRLGTYEGSPEEEEGDKGNNDITPLVRKGHLWAGIVVLLSLIGTALLVVPENAPLRGEEGELVPFYQSLVAIIFFLFLLPGIAYGIVTKQIKSDKDVARMTAESMASMGAYIVLAFVAAHLIAFFNWSNLGLIIAVSGADLLQAIGFGGIPLIVSFILVSAIINLFIGSASAKWAIMAPIFVPMLMLMGYSPELTQAAYRIGDSFTNILTPLLPYFPLIIIFAQKYQKDIGLGTLISLMVPFSIVFGIFSTLTLIIWILFGIPLGPDSPLYYIP
ncbi:MAG: AbgT family transporter [Balneolaceae bacterium]